MHRFLGITLVVLAVALAVVPMFTDCQSQGLSIQTASGTTVPMKCHWSGVAELGNAIPLLGVGAMVAFNTRRSSLFNLGILGVVLGALAIAYPTGLIGVCKTPTMLCHSAMQPALLAIGSVAVITSLGVILSSRNRKDL